MAKIESIKIRYPDKFGIKDKLRNGKTHSPEFLDLTLKSYELFSFLRNETLSITESLRTNQNVNILDHQILAAKKVKNELGGSAFLADEVGLGKTIEAGIIIKEFFITGLAKKILILAPPSLLLQWQDEMLSKFNMDFIEQKSDKRFINASSHNLLLMSHASAVFPNYVEALKNVFWDLVVVDEAHSMKNSQTLKHKLVRDLPKRNLLLLSATPMQNNLSELYNMIDLLRPGYLGTLQQFEQKYANDKNSRSLNPMFREELQNILSKIVIRTTRKECSEYIKFTDRIPHTKVLEPTENEVKLYEELTNVIREAYNSSEDSNFLALMTYQRLATSSTESSKRALFKMKMNDVIDDEKYNELMSIANSITVDSKLADLIEVIKKANSKFLIFCNFYVTQDYIAEFLQKNGFSVTLYNGKMSPDEKFESKKLFQNETQIMISTGAGGEGQNLQFCHNIVNYDLEWNPMKIEQKIGRVHRIGQTNNVQIYNYALKDTIDAYILELLFVKLKLFSETLGELDLMFEDSESEGLSTSWFKEYMEVRSNSDAENRFTTLGEDMEERQKTIKETVNEFNNRVFDNFDLSSYKKEDKN
jgi:SNF2 family DNA or RNA helicase